MLRKIRVYGRLAKFLGQRTFEAAVNSAAEAVRFLAANFPGLERHMADQHYRVSVGTYDLGEDELADPVGQQAIKIVPVLAGAGAVGKIIAGVALVASAFFTGGATIGLFGLAAPLAVSTVLAGVGVSLALSGVSQLLTPITTATTLATSNSEADPRESFSFSGIQNTSRQGLPVPIVYGETVVGSIVISVGVDTVRVRG